jgi:hypothetical protein
MNPYDIHLEIKMIEKELVNPYPLRLPVGLRAYFEQKAQENARSLHGEIVFRLTKSREQEEKREVTA